jgi:hypothetical protein
MNARCRIALAAVAALVGLATIGGLAAAGPADIPDLQVWYEADAITGLSDGDPVVTWPDSSSPGNDATQSDVNRQPTWLAAVAAINSMPAVRFSSSGGSGSHDWLDYDGTFLAGQPYTIFAVEGRTSSHNENYYTGGTQGSPNQNLILGYRTDTTVTLAQYGNDLNTTVPGYAGQQFVLSTFRSDTAPGGGKAIFFDGTYSNSNGNTTPLSAYPGAALGGRFRGYDGDIAELLVYDRALRACLKRG